jgi:hypothetical protein
MENTAPRGLVNVDCRNVTLRSAYSYWTPNRNVC